MVPILLVTILIFSAGCISPAPVIKETPGTTVFTVAPTPVISGQVSPEITSAPTSAVPVETPVQVEGYVRRPFGYVQYFYNPDHKVRLLESHVETDPTGATMIVGTIKNIGSSRIDLITVTITLLDANGNAIGSTSAENYYLGPDKVWKFRTTPFVMSDFRTHQVAEIFTG